MDGWMDGDVTMNCNTDFIILMLYLFTRDCQSIVAMRRCACWQYGSVDMVKIYKWRNFMCVENKSYEDDMKNPGQNKVSLITTNHILMIFNSNTHKNHIQEIVTRKLPQINKNKT